MNFQSLSQSFKRYALYERELMPKTVQEILRAVKKLFQSMGDTNIEQVSTAHVRAHLYQQKEERLWSARTLRNHRQYLNTFFTWCVEEGHVTENPVRKIARPKLPKTLPRFITKQQAFSVLYHTEYYPWRYKFERVRNVAIIALFLMTGLRLNELINLQLQDVDMNAQEILVRKGKGRKERIVPIYPKLERILKTYLEEKQRLNKPTAWFFHSAKSDKRMTAKTVQKVCQKISKKAKIKFTPHMLRHTFGHLSTNAGLGVYQIKEIMGHANLSSTEIYLSVAKDALKKSMYAVDLL